MSDPPPLFNKRPIQDLYEVGYGKPPAESRFKPGQSGNPKGRAKGSKNTKPTLAEERIKTLVIEEAYRTIPVFEHGRRVTIPMMTAVLRAVATNAAKGNNRAATLFTTLVSKVEAENKKLASEAFGSAIDYKQMWTKELERRKRLNLNLPDPVPHPDDIILDTNNMSFRIAGPKTKDDIPRYKLGAELLLAYKESTEKMKAQAETMQEGPELKKLQRTIALNSELVEQMTPVFGTRSQRTKDPLIKAVEDIVGVEFDLNDLASDEEN